MSPGMLEDMDPADQKKRATYQDVLDAPEHLPPTRASEGHWGYYAFEGP